MKTKNDFSLNALAIFLLSITPVICLYNSNNYPLLSAAFVFFILISLLVTMMLAWLCRYRVFRYIIFVFAIAVLVSYLSASAFVYGLIAASLVVLILREKSGIGVIASTGVIILSSFIAIEKNYPDYVINESEEPRRQGSRNLSPVIHIIFDEATGISSLSAMGKEGEAALNKLINVLTKHGFTSVRNAHSSSMWSRFSLGHIINLQEVETVSYGGDNTYYFEHNPLLDLLSKSGYQVNVIQSSYLDICTSAKFYIRSCYEYPLNSLSYFDDHAQNELSLLIPATLEQFEILNWLNRHLPKSGFSENLGFHQRMPLHHGSLSQLSVQANFLARLEKDIASNDQYYLVHFLYPHQPYFQQVGCTFKSRFDDWGDIGAWGDSLAANPILRIQSDERLELYGNYFEQYECFTQVLDGFLTKVLSISPDATVILHGDHSSRISTRHIRDNGTAGFPHLDPQNFNDLYPTLLAVKFPGNVPGIIDCRISLVEFAQHFFLGRVGPMGEKTGIIAKQLFADSDECIDQLPTLKSLR